MTKLQKTSTGLSVGKETLIRVEGASKRFCRDLKRSLLYGVRDVASDLFCRDRCNAGLRRNEFWANDDISFELKRGECLGLIGHNGAGKTTLLKMLNGLIKPDRGRIEIKGRVGALIALGAGFNPILTGRENVYVAGSVLGLTRAEIQSRYDEIVDFADLKEFMETPVQSYSSGMQVRLGFAVATALMPDILLIDEVLAVGDAGFRAKCYERIDKIRDQAAIIFVSHSMAQVARLCPRSLFLEKGTMMLDSTTSACALAYDQAIVSSAPGHRLGNGKLRIDRIEFISVSNERSNCVEYGASFEIHLSVSANVSIPDIVVDIAFRNSSNELAAECNNYVKHISIGPFSEGEQTKVIAKIANNELNPGRYLVSCFLTNLDMTEHYDWWERATNFDSIGGRQAISNIQMLANWNSFGINHSHSNE